jgi:hypothetical protein
VSVMSVLCCQVEVSASGQRSLAGFGMPECDRDAPTRRRPWPTRVPDQREGGGGKFTENRPSRL